MLPNCSALTSLDLRGNYAGPEGCAALARCLPHTPVLRTLSLVDNVLCGRYLADKEHAFDPGSSDSVPPNCSGLVALLRSSTRLSHLDLSFNFLGDEGAVALADVFASSHDAFTALSLSLGFNKLTAHGVGRLCAALRRPIGAGLALRALCLRNNTLRAAGAATLALSLELTDGHGMAVAELSLMNNHLGPEGGHTVAAAARRNPWLVSLDLTGNLLGPTGVTSLVDALYEPAPDAHVPCLEVLVLHRNNTGDAGAAAVAKALRSQTSSQLRRLHLSNSHIHSAGAAALAAAFAVNASLEHVNLQRNRFTGDDELLLKAAFTPPRTMLLGPGPI